MGSNITDNFVKLAGESMDFIDHVCHVFEPASSTKKWDSDKHSRLLFDKDLILILSVLQEQDIFTMHKGIQQPEGFFQKIKI